jgi:hypothetical protein
MDDRGDRFEDFEIETPGDDNDDDTEMVLGDLAAGQGLVHIIDEVRLHDMRGAAGEAVTPGNVAVCLCEVG